MVGLGSRHDFCCVCKQNQNGDVCPNDVAGGFPTHALLPRTVSSEQRALVDSRVERLKDVNNSEYSEMIKSSFLCNTTPNRL